MRPIHLVKVDKTRPAVILTRELARGTMKKLTVAPITSSIRDLGSEVRVGRANGLDTECVISCDNIQIVPVSAIGRAVGFLLDEQEAALAKAVLYAFDLQVEDLP